jgi:hypothetical protein
VTSGLRYVVAVVALAALAIGAYLASPLASTERPGLDLSRSRATTGGLYTVAIEPEAGDIKQSELQSWIVRVTAKDGTPVEDAKISVDGGMPEHNHGLPTAPAATENLGGGRYRVEGVKFSMGGWWELRLAVTSPAGSDNVTFNLVL